MLVVGLLAAGCAARAASPGSAGPPEPVRTVWVVGHGWHVGLVLRRQDVAAEAWPEAAELGGPGFLEVGWGDGEFYPAPRGTGGSALRAAFFSRSSVLHVAGFEAPPVRFFAGAPVVEVPLAPAGLDAVVRFIREAYARDAEGRLVPVAPARYGTGWFYRARGRYHVLDNSNTWAARALALGGCPERAWRALTATCVLEQASRCGRLVRESGRLTPPGSARTSVSPRRRRARAARGSRSTTVAGI